MKIRVTLKDPDGFYESIKRAAEESVCHLEIDEDEREALAERRREKAGEALGRWVRYGEYVTLEFDTAAGTARVVERGRDD
jgi:hypothetical protein